VQEACLRLGAQWPGGCQEPRRLADDNPGSPGFDRKRSPSVHPSYA
jgi:hypothetical protein